MRVYDITLSISPDLPTWPGDPRVELRRFSSMDDGQDANVSRMAFGVHTGTHVDAPLHFLADGASVDQLPLALLIGRVYVAYLPHVDVITAEVLENADIPPRTKRLLFKTRNSQIWAQGENTFQQDYVAISADAAEYLVKKGVKLVGVDYLSVAPYSSPVPTHRILLSANVVVVEGLDLSEVEPGRYTLYCLPLKLKDTEGAPARAILVGV